jgi:hypothetical protein
MVDLHGGTVVAEPNLHRIAGLLEVELIWQQQAIAMWLVCEVQELL